MRDSENSATTSGIASSADTSSKLRLDEFVRSDALAALSELCKRNLVFQQVIEEPLQIRLVLDANIVQCELRWRLRSRRNPEARSALQEAIDAGTVVPFAPTALAKEIEDHILEIAAYGRVSRERAGEEWANFRRRIHFYEPEGTQASNGCVDPDDVPYKLACIELGAHAVYTRDRHFESMDVPRIMLDLDKVFRKYARAKSVKLAFTVGSAFTLTISVNVLKELIKLSIEGIRRIPTPLKVAFLAAIAAMIIHPQSRAKLIEVGKNLWNKLSNPKFRAMLSSLILQLAEADRDAETAEKEIQAALPKARKRSALAHAKEVCLIERSAMTLTAMEAKIRKAGYITHSRNFKAYLQRVLRSSRAFVEVSRGRWMLRAASLNSM